MEKKFCFHCKREVMPLEQYKAYNGYYYFHHRWDYDCWEIWQKGA